MTKQPDDATFQEARTNFDRDGFAVIPGFLTPEQVAEVEERIGFYIDHLLPHMPAKAAFYEDKDDPSSLLRLEKLHERFAWGDGMLRSARIMELVGVLLGDEPVPRECTLFGKAPRVGKETPAHQHGYYFMLEPNEALTVWLPIDAVDEENGCIRYVPGSHRRGMRPHGRSQVFGFSQGVEDYGPADIEAEAVITAAPGDLIAHHSMIIHRADPNRSDRRRWALGLVYYAERAREDRAARDAYDARLKKEWAAAGKL